MNIKFRYCLVFMLITGLLLMSGCSQNLPTNGNGLNDLDDIVYRYSGSIGVGDFVMVEINLTAQTYKFENLITGDTGSGDFQDYSNTFYAITSGELSGNYFTFLADQILVVSVAEAEEGQRLIAALREIDSPYGDAIKGTYNLATSLEGWVGVVEIDTLNNQVDVKLDMDGDGDYDDEFEGEPEDLPLMDYTFNEDYKAIEIIEDEEFRHYGIFLNNDIGIFDSYVWDETAEDWTGDGMFVLVKQPDSVNLADYAGEYTYIDVDASFGTFKLIEEGEGLKFIVDNEDTGIIFEQENIEDGVIKFEADLLGDQEEPSEQTWYFIFLPGQVLVAASSHEEAFGGDLGGIAIGICDKKL
ncbi:MAG TPA: hypothetical protein VKY40_08785 [Halanaerobiales bacterium]|nr:hypothetical protein [Halanaerobiales bacterium]